MAPMYFFTLMVEDRLDFSVYRAVFDMHIATDEINDFPALMQSFFEGKYYFNIEPDANGLELFFKIVIDGIVLKQFKLQLPVFQKLSETEEHAARILQLETQIESMKKTLEKINVFIEHLVGNCEEATTVISLTIADQTQVVSSQAYSGTTYVEKVYRVSAFNATTVLTIDWTKSFVSTDGAHPKQSIKLGEVYRRYPDPYSYGHEKTSTPKLDIHLFKLKFLETVEFVNYAGADLSSFFHATCGSNTLKHIKLENCPKLEKLDIPASWWNTKVLTFKNCPGIDFEYLFDGKKRSIKTINIAFSCGLMERYFSRLQEIGICLKTFN